MVDDRSSQKFLIGQRVRVAEAARGAHWPEVNWIAQVHYEPAEGQVLYGIATTWPPAHRSNIQEGFFASELTLWAD